MMTREAAWRQFVEEYNIEVPEESIENELRYIMTEMRHRLQYDTLINHVPHFQAQAELADQEDEYRALAFYEAKSDLVMKKLLTEWNPAVTRKELEEEAEAVAMRQNSTIDMVKSFFGEDLAMLERDIKERKIKDRILEASVSMS